MKIRNRMGPRSLPWGTPALTGRGDWRYVGFIKLLAGKSDMSFGQVCWGFCLSDKQNCLSQTI